MSYITRISPFDHGAEPPPGPTQRAIQALLRRVVDRVPELGPHGFGPHQGAWTFDTPTLCQFSNATGWLGRLPLPPRANTHAVNSYQLKGFCEWGIGVYCPHGVFIAAAISEGFPVTWNGGPPECWIELAPGSFETIASGAYNHWRAA